MSKLFEIPTIVKAQYEGEIDLRLVSVRITTTMKKRSAIWKLVVNGDLNPGAARYGYREDTPTTITLTPYPGYDGALVANMAYAFACITEADDWTHLFSVPASRFGEKNVKTEGFQPDYDVALEIQRSQHRRHLRLESRGHRVPTSRRRNFYGFCQCRGQRSQSRRICQSGARHRLDQAGKPDDHQA